MQVLVCLKSQNFGAFNGNSSPNKKGYSTYIISNNCKGIMYRMLADNVFTMHNEIVFIIIL